MPQSHYFRFRDGLLPHEPAQEPEYGQLSQALSPEVFMKRERRKINMKAAAATTAPAMI